MGRIALLLLVGCAGQDWRNADLQIDVSGWEISDEDRVRICVEDAGQKEQAVGAGSMSFAGLPAQGELRIWVDLIADDERLARAGPTQLGESQDFATLQWAACQAACQPCEDDGRGASKTDKSRLLAVRFLD